MTERTRIVDVSERRAFRTIYETINWCVGTDYRYWGKACWPSMNPAYGFRLWFTQLADIERGRFVPAVNNYRNLLCCNGNYHVYDKIVPIESDVNPVYNWKYDLLFSKEVGGYYYFRGVFIVDYNHSGPNHRVSRRVATKAKLTGCPANRLELLDTVEEVEFDEDYLKKHIFSSDVVDVGPESETSILRSGNSVVNKPRQAITPVKTAEISDEECSRLFPVQCRIYHKSFGFGNVKSIDDGIITINFDRGGTKELSVNFCVKNKLIEKKN